MHVDKPAADPFADPFDRRGRTPEPPAPHPPTEAQGVRRKRPVPPYFCRAMEGEENQDQRGGGDRRL